MNRRPIHYFMGSSFAEYVLPYLREHLTRYEWSPITASTQIPAKALVLLSPIPGNMAQEFLAALPSDSHIFLLLDHNHQQFDDLTALIRSKRIRAGFSPFIVTGLKTYIIPSLSLLVAQNSPIPKPSNLHDILFVSQPLQEDRRGEPDQHQLLHSLLNLAEDEDRLVFLKRHPREQSSLPPQLMEHHRLRVWAESIDVAYGRFQRWYGLNSLPLFTAQALGRDVFYWHDDGTWGPL